MQMSRLQLRLLDHPCRHRAPALCPGRSGLRAVCLSKGFGTVASPGKLKLTWAMCCIMNVVQPIVLGAAETSPTIFPSPLLSGSEIRAKWNAVSLAFIGDSVWELYTRRRHFHPPQKPGLYYNAVIREVRAESQERYLEQLQATPLLTDHEREIIKWGKNAKITIPKRLSRSGAHTLTYRNATALECLVGFLYLSDPARLDVLMSDLGFGLQPKPSA